MLLNESNCVGVPNSFQDFLEFDNKVHGLLFPLHVRFFLHPSFSLFVVNRSLIENYVVDRFTIETDILQKIMLWLDPL